MRRSKEIVILLALLVGTMAFVLGYVIDRRAKNRAAPAPVTQQLLPQPSLPMAEPVDLTKHEGQTIDFSSGQPVAKNTAADQAALDSALADIAAATKDLTISPPATTSAPPANP